MTDFQAAHADALVRFAQAIRPEWQAEPIRGAIAHAYRTISTDLEQITLAVVRCAANPKIRKPDVIAMRGDHWTAPRIPTNEGAPRRPFTREGSCDICHLPKEQCQRVWVHDHEFVSHAEAQARAVAARQRRTQEDA